MSHSVRTKQFKDKIAKEWTQKYWSFLRELPGKDWNWYNLS